VRHHAPTPKSQVAASPSTPAPRGLVSGHTRAMPWAAAARWAPAFVMKFSSVQVKPDSQYRTGTGEAAVAAGGRYTVNVLLTQAHAVAEHREHRTPHTAHRHIRTP
jgi:hypothetical protein